MSRVASIVINMLAMSLVLLASSACADTILVPSQAATIQEGLNQAVPGDSVLVAAGVYMEHDILMKSGVALISETGEASCATISIQQLGRGIYCRYVNSMSLIKGFTITGGYLSASMTGEDGGAGIYCLDNSSPGIVNCLLTDNYANGNGGGLYCDINSSPTITDCTISNNTAGNGGSGICLSNNSSPAMLRCEVTYNDGTGIWTTSSSSPSLTDCTISNNTSSGLYLTSSTSGTPGHVTFTNCTIRSNTGIEGAGLRLWGSDATLSGCTVSNNIAGSVGGAMRLMESSVTLTDCALWSNRGSSGGAMYLKSNSSCTAEDVQFLFNIVSDSGPIGFVETECVVLLNCSVTDLSGFTGDGTITMDNTACPTTNETVSWGEVKSRFR